MSCSIRNGRVTCSLLGCVLLIPILSLSRAFGQTNSWITPGDGYWTEAVNWSAGQPSTNGQSLVQITNAVTKTVIIDANATNTPATLTINSLFLSAPPGSTNALLLRNVRSSVPLQVLNTFTANGATAVAVDNSSLSVAGTLTIGNSASGNQLFITNGGHVRDANCYVGNSNGANGNLVFVSGAGSMFSNATSLFFGYFAGSNTLIVGDGATLVDSQCIVGYWASSSNNLAVVTGTGSVWRSTSNLNFGNMGRANTLLVTNGGKIYARYGDLGWNNGGNNNIAIISGMGSSWSNNLMLRVGSYGNGNQLIAADGGALYSTNGWLGYGSGSSNTIMVTDPGSLWMMAGSLCVGSNGPANRLIITNGAAVVAQGAQIGLGASATNNQIILAGGSLIDTNATGTAVLDVRRGMFEMTGGTAWIDNLVATNGISSIIKFNHGTIRASAATITSGQVFTIGNGTASATYEALGGTHVFESGLYIQTNGTMTGAGAITGAILNDGTILADSPLTINDLVTNNATIIATNSATVVFNSMVFNSGTMDAISGSLLFRGGLVNNGSIAGSNSPLAGFTAVPTTGGVPLSVTFTDNSSGVITNWFWDFGDGTTTNATNKQISHSYTNSGIYSVCLTVSGPFGESTETLDNTILPPENSTHYVDACSTNPVFPYISWATAAQTIQDAVDASTDGDTVLVTNGVYATGGRAVHAAMTNRVAITKPLLVQSVSGPDVTIITGEGPLGASAVRCAYVTNGASLAGFTLSNGFTKATGDAYTERDGGGVWCATGALVSNCILIANSASYYGGGARGGILKSCTLQGNASDYSKFGMGGGAYGSSLINCAIASNSAWASGGGVRQCSLMNCTLAGNSAVFSGGGASQSTLTNCTVIGNSACGYGGGTAASTHRNCIIYYNTAPEDPDCAAPILSYSCTTTNTGGTGNITNEPGFVSMTRIAVNSPCVGKGSATYASGVDMDGEAWRSPPSIGADEPYAASLTGGLSVAVGAAHPSVAVGREITFTSLAQGPVASNLWTFGDGSALANRAWATHSWATAGTYAVTLSAWNSSDPAGVTCTTLISVAAQSTFYVRLNNTTPMPPYTNWATAATNIQQAIDASSIAGRIVLVTNGTYQVGGIAVNGTMTNRIALRNTVMVCSVNGPAATVIQGKGPSGTSAVRCAYVAKDCMLLGFTLTNGGTRTSGYALEECAGGGVWCESGALVSNCAIVACSASYGGGACFGAIKDCSFQGNSVPFDGGGAYWGALENCLLISNSSQGNFSGGAFGGLLNNCLIASNVANGGGGVTSARLNNCTLVGNQARSGGGGAWESTLNGCVIIGNSADGPGGGALRSTLNNCTLTANSSRSNGGGSDTSTNRNCIVYYNTAPTEENWSEGTWAYCCTTPCPAGSGNISLEPALVSATHLASNSPCVGKGSATYAKGTDIDGEAWRTPPSIGADEPFANLATGAVTVTIGAASTKGSSGILVGGFQCVKGDISSFPR